MSSLQEIALVVIGIILIVGIGLWIAADARRRAPVADPEHPDGPEHPRRSQQQRSRDRARSRRAKQARKHNRPR
jgi:hypothetical protein